MPAYPIHFAKANLSDLVARAEAGEEVIIARGAKAAVRLVPVAAMSERRRPRPPQGPARRGPGVLRALARGRVGHRGDFLTRLLLDTHAFLWWLANDPALSHAASSAIGTGANQVYVSAATAWEITTKYRIGKLAGAALVAADVAAEIAAEGFLELAVTVAHAQHAGVIPGPHNDPVDRLLIAQALAEAMALVSNESLFDGYAVTRLW